MTSSFFEMCKNIKNEHNYTTNKSSQLKSIIYKFYISRVVFALSVYTYNDTLFIIKFTIKGKMLFQDNYLKIQSFYLPLKFFIHLKAIKVQRILFIINITQHIKA